MADGAADSLALKLGANEFLTKLLDFALLRQKLDPLNNT